MTLHVQFRIPRRDGVKASLMTTTGKMVTMATHVAFRRMRVLVCVRVCVWAHIVTEYDDARSNIADLNQMIVIHEGLVSALALPWC